VGCSWLGCRAHILPITGSLLFALVGGSQGTEGGGSSQSRITESSMGGHQLFYISICVYFWKKSENIFIHFIGKNMKIK
jgi:hypothetical protein